MTDDEDDWDAMQPGARARTRAPRPWPERWTAERLRTVRARIAPSEPAPITDDWFPAPRIIPTPNGNPTKHDLDKWERAADHFLQARAPSRTARKRAARLVAAFAAVLVVTTTTSTKGCRAPCAYCGQHLTLDDATVDHVTPLSWGGKDVPQNHAIACFACNLRKGDQTVEAFTDWLATPAGNAWKERPWIERTKGARPRDR